MDKYLKGTLGFKGEKGFSPIIETSKTGKTTTLTITDAEGEKTALINDGENGNPTFIVTTENTDLDNYIADGVYYFSSNYTPANIPTGVNGWLQVFTSHSNIIIKQIWYRQGTADTTDKATYVRTKTGGTWSTWEKYAVGNDLKPIKFSVTCENGWDEDLDCICDGKINNYDNDISSYQLYSMISGRLVYNSDNAITFEYDTTLFTISDCLPLIGVYVPFIGYYRTNNNTNEMFYGILNISGLDGKARIHIVSDNITCKKCNICFSASYWAKRS